MNHEKNCYTEWVRTIPPNHTFQRRERLATRGKEQNTWHLMGTAETSESSKRKLRAKISPQL